MSPADLEAWLANLAPNASPLSIGHIGLSLGTTFLAMVVVILLYGRLARPVGRPRHFPTTLMGASLVTTLVILPIHQNITLSLGMVGALSIVRFRAAIKDPLDIIFLFWAIAIGIAAGASFFGVALLGTVGVAALLAVTHILTGASDRWMLVVRGTASAETAIHAALPRHRPQSRSQTGTGLELIVELTHPPTADLVSRLLALDGVDEAHVVQAVAD